MSSHAWDKAARATWGSGDQRQWPQCCERGHRVVTGSLVVMARTATGSPG
jgi:hypothetical protein